MRPDGRTPPAERPATARVFFALWPAPELAAGLAALAREAAATAGGRPMRQETIHLTLAFLGDVPEVRLPELAQRAAAIRLPGFELCLDRLGFWRHNRLLWAGGKTPPALLGLVDALRATLADAGLPADGGRREFTPHITLLRKLPAAVDLPQQRAIAPFSWPCRRFVLVRSRLSASGPDYQILAEFPLAQ